MVTQDAPLYTRSAIETIGHEDFETASIRSAAPSYLSEAPSYHSVAHNNEPAPPYSPPANSNSAAGSSGVRQIGSVSSLLGPEPPGSGQNRRYGLPPVPSGPPRWAEAPDLAQFRIPSWATITANPAARHYHSVASRRATAAVSTTHMDEMRRVLERVEEEERHRTRPLEDPSLVGEEAARRARQERSFRPLEDPYLVGEAAATQARNERLARENGDDILIRENQRWDLFLAQMKDQDERERSWKRMRRAVARRSSTKLAQRIGGFGSR